MQWSAADIPCLAICAASLLVALASRADAATLLSANGVTVDSEFPGGNGFVERIEGDTVFVRQDVRDTRGDWFWWHFRVRGAAGRSLAFHFTKSNVVGVRGPAVSTDRGVTWAWLGKKAVRGASFRYTFAADAKDVQFCFAIPYFSRDLTRFLREFKGNPHLRKKLLCTTRKGRRSERLHVGCLDAEPDHRVLITARHHCCECMASYTVEGIIEAVLANTPDGKWLRKHVEFLIVPFADKDGVEDGDQGKNRKPRDHARDYAGKSIYPATKAIRELVPTWSAGRLRAAFDIHCPHIRGRTNELIYIVGLGGDGVWEQQTRFARLLEAACTGPLPYRASHNMPFGKSWNTAANYRQGKTILMWASQLPGVKLLAPFEIPYANAGGKRVTAASARDFGHDVAKALRQYLEER